MSSLANFFTSLFSNRKLNLVVLSAAATTIGVSAWLFYRRAAALNPKNFWNAKYKDKPSLFGPEPRKWLVEQETRLRTLARQQAPRLLNVLDVAGGQGQNSAWLLETFTKSQDAGTNQSVFNVTSVDISNEALKAAQKTVLEKVGEPLASKYFKTVQSNIMEEDLDANKYDVIMCFFIQFTADHAELHKKLANSLRPGGLLILQGFSKKHYENRKYGPPNPDFYYDGSDLRREFGRDLLIFELTESEEELHAGIHDGPACLVSMVATKSPTALNN